MTGFCLIYQRLGTILELTSVKLPGFWLLYKRFENGQLAWPRSTTEVQALTPEQVEWLMKGFSITPKILESQSRHFY